MIHVITSYLKFLWKSQNEHGLHSPFVFNLVTKCFYDKTNYPSYSELNGYRQALVQNHNTIDVTDFGAGSKVFNSNTRKISRIAKNAGISGKRAELLFRVVKYFKSENILEIGTSLGMATAALSLGNKHGKITTLEGCPETSKTASRQFAKFRLDNIESVVTEFSTYLASDLQTPAFDLIYFDGNHQKEATLRYFDLLLETTSNDSVWIFDDIHWSRNMEQAWDIIVQNPKVTVTIDTFQWGFVFFRKEQKKQHFVIRA